MTVILVFVASLFWFEQTNDIMIVAHRGASKSAPENTLPAFKLAWEQGADAIEGDFHMTKDGQIVCIHDHNTKKVARQNLIVKESTLAELRTLDVGLWKDKEYRGTIIPTLDEVLKTVPKSKKIYIEIKCGPEIVPVLVPALKKSQLTLDQIVIISFNKLVIKEIKKMAPDYKANWLLSLRKGNQDQTVPEIKKVLTTLSDIQADGLSTSSNLKESTYIKAILSAGYEYHVWTIDNPQTAKRFIEWGAMSITTNVPGLMRKELKN